jgi:hypothetical protein
LLEEARYSLIFHKPSTRWVFMVLSTPLDVSRPAIPVRDPDIAEQFYADVCARP